MNGQSLIISFCILKYMYRASSQVNGLESNVWGPHGWFFLESICLAYPDAPSSQDKQRIKEFFYALQHVLPCPTCRENYAQHLIDHPLTDAAVMSRANLVTWILSIHNSVRQSTGKRPFSLQEFLAYYQQRYAGDSSAESSTESSASTGVVTAIGFFSGFVVSKLL